MIKQIELEENMAEMMNVDPKKIAKINELIQEAKKINPNIKFGVNPSLPNGSEYLIVGFFPEAVRNKFKSIGATFRMV